jgi:putative transcriptional regulator
MTTNILFIRSMEEEDFLKKVGKTIEKIRKEAGFTQVELGARCGWGRQNINRLEKGRHNPSVLVLNEIAKALKVPLKDLLDFGDAEV